MAINDTLKQKIDELDLDRRLNEVVDQVEKTVSVALDKAGNYAASHRTDLHSWIDKASATVDARTDGKFAGSVARARTKAELAVEKLADRGTRPE